MTMLGRVSLAKLRADDSIAHAWNHLSAHWLTVLLSRGLLPVFADQVIDRMRSPFIALTGTQWFPVPDEATAERFADLKPTLKSGIERLFNAVFEERLEAEYSRILEQHELPRHEHDEPPHELH